MISLGILVRYRLVFDLRHLNKFVREMSLSMETLKRLRLLAQKADHMVSFDVKDGFYHVGLYEADRRFFQVAIAGGAVTSSSASAN